MTYTVSSGALNSTPSIHPYVHFIQGDLRQSLFELLVNTCKAGILNWNNWKCSTNKSIITGICAQEKSQAYDYRIKNAYCSLYLCSQLEMIRPISLQTAKQEGN